MSLFQRAHDILAAKANKALDAAEKPDEMLDLSYEQMLDQITQVRRALVTIAASRKQIELQEQQLQHSVDHLQDQAKAALAQGREDLAREALSRKAAAQAQIDGMEPQHQQLAEQEEKLEQTLQALQKRVNDFRTQKEVLKAQYTAAQRGELGERERGRDLEHAGRLGGGAAAGPGQDRHHAGPGRRAGRAAAVRRARGRRRRHRRHPEGTGRGRDGRRGGQRARRAEGPDRPGQHAAGADQRLTRPCAGRAEPAGRIAGPYRRVRPASTPVWVMIVEGFVILGTITALVLMRQQGNRLA